MSFANSIAEPQGEPRAAKLAVIIPARNAAATIPQCLGALLAQTSNDDEVIVVDDFSTDNTGEVAARFNVKVVRLSRHMGISAARNRGVELTHAPLLFFYDSEL